MNKSEHQKTKSESGAILVTTLYLALIINWLGGPLRFAMPHWNYGFMAVVFLMPIIAVVDWLRSPWSKVKFYCLLGLVPAALVVLPATSDGPARCQLSILPVTEGSET